MMFQKLIDLRVKFSMRNNFWLKIVLILLKYLIVGGYMIISH